MAHKPIFVATHPRACSTAFERVGFLILHAFAEANTKMVPRFL